MRLGICTPYCRCEATYAALRLADWAQQHGHTITLYASASRTPKLSRRWDTTVRATDALLFTTWAKSCDTILWTYAPPAAQIQWAGDNGIRTVVLVFWHLLRAEDRKTLLCAHQILAPSMAAAQFLTERWRIRTAAAPWDTGAPITKKDARLKSTERWLLLPLFDREARQVEGTALDIAGRALQRYPDVKLTVAFNSSTLLPFVKRRLKQLAKYFPGRVSLLTGIPHEHRPILFQQHDLLLWPTHAENTGMTGLCAVAMGTPVLAYDAAPAREFVSQRNGVLVPCREEQNELGVPRPIPDYPGFEHSLRKILDNPTVLGELQQSTSLGLRHRKQVFTEVISRAITA